MHVTDSHTSTHEIFTVNHSHLTKNDLKMLNFLDIRVKSVNKEVRRKSMVDNGASGSHLNGNFSEDDDESISEQSSIASDTR